LDDISASILASKHSDWQGDTDLKIETAGITDVGRKRSGNEDSLFYDDEMQIYVVSDGMGGHVAGEVASRIVVETFRDKMKEFVGDVEEKGFYNYDETLSADANKINTCIHLANKNVFETASENDGYRGMGATVSTIFIVDRMLVIGNVGDSPIYLIRDGEVELISVMHTVMAEHAALAPEGAKPLSEKYRHMITRAMGIKPEVQPDFSEMPFFPGDNIVICSDGLSDKASPEDIMEVVLQHDSVQNACQALVDMANSRGGDDNITVIVLRFHNGDEDEEDTVPSLEEAETDPSFEHPSEEATDPGVLEDHPPDAPAVEKKAWPKLSRAIAVEYDTDEASFRSMVREFDETGFFIKTLEPIPEGQELMLTITDPETDDSVMVDGRVKQRTQSGLEIEFINLTPEEKEEILAFSKR
jgi:protein phosphatase